MPKNVMKLIKPSPHRARNDFDLSHRSVFSQNFGELIPSTCIETVPGDHLEISVANLMRAIPMVTSPFLRAKQHVDLWFVPYRDLWHNFDAFMTQKNQPVSSALKSSLYIPHSNIYDLYHSLTYTSNNDVIGRSVDIGGSRLLNYLGYANSTHASSTSPNKVNLFRLAAYNYIWYNEYRQQYYDSGNTIIGNSYSPACLFNFDDLLCDTESNAEISSSPIFTTWLQRLQGMCQMRYRCWKKDLFTGLLPSQQFGNVSSLYVEGQTGVDTYLWQDSTGNALANRVNVVTDSNGYLREDDGSYTPIRHRHEVTKTNALGFDVLALRKSEAVQIWRENALRAGNRTSDNMRAHYGVESDFRDHRPMYIGSVDAPLNIGDVLATANSDYSGNTNPNTNVGDIAGKGSSAVSDNHFKFDAKDFGVVMAISSVLPEAEYNAFGIDRMNQLLEMEDFFVPEYENLGLEPVISSTFVNVPSNVHRVIGYAPRYIGYKTKLDKCYDGFMTGGMFAPWCSPKKDVAQVLNNPGTSIPLSLLYVNASLYDVNFNVGIANSNQFLNDTYFDVAKVSSMSVLGLPFS